MNAVDVHGLPVEEINALPEHVRKYVMWLETEADPAGTIRENFRLNEENAALRALIRDKSALRQSGEAVAWMWRHPRIGGGSEWTPSTLAPSEKEIAAGYEFRPLVFGDTAPPATSGLVEALREYHVARSAYEEATRPLNSHAQPRLLARGDPILRRYVEARERLAALKDIA